MNYDKITTTMAKALSESDGPFDVVIHRHFSSVYISLTKEEIAKITKDSNVVEIDMTKRIESRRLVDKR